MMQRMKMTNDRRCELCRFCSNGLCFRNPPVLYPCEMDGEEAVEVTFPEAKTVCKEFRKREEDHEA